MKLLIDASRCRSGGAVAHLKGLLNHENNIKGRFDEVYLVGYRGLLTEVNDYPWLVKLNFRLLEGHLIFQLFWQFFSLPILVRKYKVDLVFTADASTLYLGKKQVVLSQDMLSYEPGVMRQFGRGVSRLRLELILLIQNLAFRRASGVIFLTDYASSVIQNSCGILRNIRVINHGIDKPLILNSGKALSVIRGYYEPISCLYISNVSFYKHQWHVVKGIEILRSRGFNVNLTLVGGGSGSSLIKLERQMRLSDPNKEFVYYQGHVEHSKIADYLSRADLFVFASGCENMPITLLEAMSCGLPIASSSRGPMNEVLKDGGLYFNPESPVEIADSLQELIENDDLRNTLVQHSMAYAQNYTWEKCSNETFQYLKEVAIKLDRNSD